MVLAYCVYIFILVYSVGFAWLTLHCKQLRNYKIWRWDVLIPVLLVSASNCKCKMKIFYFVLRLASISSTSALKALSTSTCPFTILQA